MFRVSESRLMVGLAWYAFRSLVLVRGGVPWRLVGFWLWTSWLGFLEAREFFNRLAPGHLVDVAINLVAFAGAVAG